MEIGCRAVITGMACVLLSSMSAGFEELVVWQHARRFCAELMPAVSAARKACDFELSHQMNSAGISIMSNIAEGHLRRRRRQFAHFLDISAGSNGEIRSCLYLALDRSYVTVEAFESLRDQSDRIGRMLEALRATVLRQRDPRD